MPCRAKFWVSDTAIYVTTPKATQFLAGAHLELPLRVIVGLNLPRTMQEGNMIDAYSYDLIKERYFELTNTEINFLAFVSAIAGAGFVIYCFHRKYTSQWFLLHVLL
jgi:hypothetical protein